MSEGYDQARFAPRPRRQATNSHDRANLDAELELIRARIDTITARGREDFHDLRRRLHGNHPTRRPARTPRVRTPHGSDHPAGAPRHPHNTQHRGSHRIPVHERRPVLARRHATGPCHIGPTPRTVTASPTPARNEDRAISDFLHQRVRDSRCQRHGKNGTAGVDDPDRCCRTGILTRSVSGTGCPPMPGRRCFVPGRRRPSRQPARAPRGWPEVPVRGRRRTWNGVPRRPCRG